MKTIHQTVQVRFHYATHFTHRIFDTPNSVLRNTIASGGITPGKALFVIDGFVCANCPSLVDQISDYCRVHAAAIDHVTSPLVVPGGEAVKNATQSIELIHSLVNDHGLCRHSFIVVIGGGAVLDMAGYAAATPYGGIRLIRVPTSVLSQSDSGLGVKNSINKFRKKNFLGTFAPPYAVINDFHFLKTLPDRDWRAGISEAIKVALIRDASFFKFIEDSFRLLNARNSAAMEQLIYRCAELHMQHLGGLDAFENGSSLPLNLGHWAAHKLEQLTSDGLRHGEAVAIGLALDTTYSYVTGRLAEGTWKRVLSLLESFGFSLYVAEMDQCDPAQWNPLLDGLSELRQHLGGELTVMLLEDIGRGVKNNEMDPSAISASIEMLKRIATRRLSSPIHSRSAEADLRDTNAPARFQ